MPFIVTPGQLTQRAEFYHQLGQLTAAGLGLVQALEQLRRSPPAGSYREPIQRILDGLTQGCTLSEAVEYEKSWLPRFDTALIHAGEQSGRLDAVFRLLADHYAERARLARQVLADMAYPAFLLHFFVFIAPFPHFFISGSWLTYLSQTFGVLIPVYAVVAFLIYAGQSKHGETWRKWIESVLRPIPVLGTARWYLALARLAAALEALIAAGVNIFEAWDMAATASGSPALRRIVSSWKPVLKSGQTPGEAMTASSKFPDLFTNQYVSGEVAGKLEETLHRLHNYYQEEGSRKLRAVSKWVPLGIYLIIVIVIAIYVVRFYLGYFQQVRDAGGF